MLLLAISHVKQTVGVKPTHYPMPAKAAAPAQSEGLTLSAGFHSRSVTSELASLTQPRNHHRCGRNLRMFSANWLFDNLSNLFAINIVEALNSVTT